MIGIEPPSPTWKEGVMTIIRHLHLVDEQHLSFLRLPTKAHWSERPGSNRLPSPWQGDALPNELLSQCCGPDRARTYDLRIMSAVL